MGLASIPFLVSILAAIRVGLVEMWRIAKERVHTIAVWMGIIVPWILQWMISLRGWRLIVLVSLASLFTAAIHQVVTFAISTWQFADILAWSFEQFGFVGWLIWDGPLQLSVAWARFWDLFSIWVSLVLLKLGLSKLSWWREVARGLVNPGM